LYLQRDKWKTRAIIEIISITNKEKRHQYRVSNECRRLAPNRICYKKSLYGQLRDGINNMQLTRQPLVKEIEPLECKVSI
jgi:hypothetical protein